MMNKQGISDAKQAPRERYDVAVIGGGIHGVSMAAEAAGRGLKVILLQARDIAQGASSATSTLLSGDLRRVEQLAWGQVRRNLVEQTRLRERAPHLVQCRGYSILADPAVRSERRLRAMLWLYRRLQPKPPLVTEDSTSANESLVQNSGSLTYSDCSGLDYRLTICTALQAKARGADIRPRHRVVEAQRKGDTWTLAVEPQSETQSEQTRANANHQRFAVEATCVINSCGWLANDLLNHVLKCPSRCVARPLNVGYLILRKTYAGDHGYALQARDRRLVYATPLLDNYLVVGPAVATEDVNKSVAVDALIGLYNRYFHQPINRGDILHQRWSRHAVFDDPSSPSMDNQLGEAILDLNNPYGQAPLLNVFGINILTHALLAERGLNILQPFTGKAANSALKKQKLPGASDGDTVAELRLVYPALDEQLLQRLARTYGNLSYEILGERRTMAELGKDFGHNLYEAEVHYLKRCEWATTAEDILWRRTQLGIRFNDEQVRALDAWLHAKPND